MSENPHDCVVIFAGYKKKLQQGIFRIQPGLPRRCMWHFECEEYNPDELFEILALQVSKNGWQFADADYVKKLVRKHYKLFASFGGDTERLAHYARLEHTSDEMHGNTVRQHVLENRHFDVAMHELQNNNIHKDAEPISTEQLEEILRGLQEAPRSPGKQSPRRQSPRKQSPKKQLPQPPAVQIESTEKPEVLPPRSNRFSRKMHHHL